MEKRISREDLMAMDRMTRAALVNSVPGFKSVVLVGTSNAAGINNLAVFNSVVHVGSNPPLIGLMFRPRTAEVGHTYRNAKKTGYYTINLLQFGFLDAAHQASSKYPEHVSEFEACGLQPMFSADFAAPYVAESPVRIGLRWQEEHAIAANGTSFVVGSVEEIFVPEECVGSDGFVNLTEAGILAGSGGDAYGPAGPFLRLPYTGNTAVHADR